MLFYNPNTRGLASCPVKFQDLVNRSQGFWRLKRSSSRFAVHFPLVFAKTFLVKGEVKCRTQHRAINYYELWRARLAFFVDDHAVLNGKIGVVMAA